MKRLLLLFMLAMTPFAGAQSKPIAISGVRIEAGDGTRIEHGVVIIHEGRIVAAGANVPIPDGVDQIGFPNAVLTPGFIDAAFSLPLQEGAAEHVSEVVPQFRMIDALDAGSRLFKRLAQEGVTTVFVTGDGAAVVGSRAAVLKTAGPADRRVMVDDGPVKATFTQEPESRGMRNSTPFGRGAVNVNVRRPTTQMGTAFVFRDALQRAANRRAKAGEATSASPAAVEAIELLGDVIDGRRGLRFAAITGYEIEASLRLCGEFGLKPVLERATEVWKCIDKVKAAGASVVLGPMMGSDGMGGGGGFGRRAPTSDRLLSTPVRLAEAGIPFALTAHGGTRELGLRRQAMTAVRYGLDRGTALKAITSEAARLSGVADRTGVIKAGLDADLLIWSGDPFEPTSALLAVYSGGLKLEGISN